MITIGLTGGSGVGKTTVCQFFKKYGIPSLDTDLVSRAVCQPGSPCLASLIEYFGKSIIRGDGTLNRRKLAVIVFEEKNDEKRAEKLQMLNQITHRYILASCSCWQNDRKAEGCSAAIIDAPLLFESGYNEHCDTVVGILADQEVRVARIMERDALDETAARARISAQKSEAFLREHCDHLIMNNGTLDETEAQVRAVAEAILGKGGSV